ncbi:MAG TPA: ribosome-associated translation inhibitor RaiA [Terriglobales bacterium]|jgi:ribosome hibernation promoting factor|nr:ribosome-associated translation inhibitor RaiA [Terriglobales bacterium]
MNVEYTGRQFEITPRIRKEVETGLAKIVKILGDNFKTKVILTVEKHRHKAEITINPRNHSLVGLAEAADMLAAIGAAMERIEQQAVKYKTRWRTKKRQPKDKWNGQAQQEELRIAVGASAETAVPLVAHNYPASPRATEPHIVRSRNGVAMRPLTLEEAVKEAQFRDQDVFVFRDPNGKVMVLHRTKDGRMELIEAP